MGYFKDVTPESAGISSKGILNFLDRIEENQIELHSFYGDPPWTVCGEGLVEAV